MSEEECPAEGLLEALTQAGPLLRCARVLRTRGCAGVGAMSLAEPRSERERRDACRYILEGRELQFYKKKMEKKKGGAKS